MLSKRRRTLISERVLESQIQHYVMKLVNPLNAELNPICHLLALLGAHHILHVSRIRFKLVMHYTRKRYRIFLDRHYVCTHHFCWRKIKIDDFPVAFSFQVPLKPVTV
jgi:hypothetical protein